MSVIVKRILFLSLNVVIFLSYAGGGAGGEGGGVGGGGDLAAWKLHGEGGGYYMSDEVTRERAVEFITSVVENAEIGRSGVIVFKVTGEGVDGGGKTINLKRSPAGEIREMNSDSHFSGDGSDTGSGKIIPSLIEYREGGSSGGD